MSTTPEAPPVNTPPLQDKRLLLTALSMLIIAANKKLGLELDVGDLSAIGGLTAAYIAQSQWGSVKKAETAGKAAADKVRTVEDADAVLGVVK